MESPPLESPPLESSPFSGRAEAEVRLGRATQATFEEEEEEGAAVAEGEEC